MSIPQNRSSRFVPLTLTIVLLASCSHSDAFDNAAPKVGPAGFGGDIQLTFNTDQNYWPIATEDGGGILYAFVDVSQAGGATHRCMGLMPVAGGTRAWQWCDTRAAVGDSSTSFPAFALGSDGRLLYAEATAPRLFPFEGPFVTLWLADSATPFRRRALVTLPVTLADSTVSWLADLRWTGPNTFVALGQRFVPGSCDNC
ncbi:MAG: hypothetical protein ACRELE_05205, partial [Gemmatimonadales bacterium]